MSPEIVTQLDTVFDSVLDALDASIQNEERMQAKTAELQQKVVDTERVYLEKVAAAEKQGLDSEKVKQALNRLVMLNVIPFTSQTKAAAQIEEDPNKVLTLLTQVAETLTSAPAEGYGIQKSASDHEQDSSSDPDGWDEVRQGRVPKLRS